MSKLINPFDEHETLAEESPLSPPNLQTDSAEAIVLALADCDPVAYTATLLDDQGPTALNLECVLCHGEIPEGHVSSCVWWRAHEFKRKREGG